MFFKGLIFLVFIVMGTQAFAVSSNEFYFGAGVLPYNMYKTTTNRQGSVSPLAEIYYPIEVRGYWQIYNETLLSPRLAYTLIGRETDDGAADTSIFIFSLPLTWKFGADQSWDTSLGVGLIRYTLAGKGGSVVLNNGASGSATFARPGRDVTSQLWSFEAGIGKNVGESRDYHWGLDLMVTGLISEARSYSLLFSFSYHFLTTGNSW